MAKSNCEGEHVQPFLLPCTPKDQLTFILISFHLPQEHLELFAGIRGVRKEEMADTVQKWLESVDLDLVQHTRVSTFSGGMKRRLSVAISTIGNAPIIVLDEPTTGMLID